MCAQRRRTRKGRPRRQAPKTLPDDLFDYDDDPAPRIGPPRGSPLHVLDVEKLPVIDDWPEKLPVTEEEIDIFERYFGHVLDRLFGPIDLESENKSLSFLSSNDKERP
jgi:hypothetical protein